MPLISALLLTVFMVSCASPDRTSRQPAQQGTTIESLGGGKAVISIDWKYFWGLFSNKQKRERKAAELHYCTTGYASIVEQRARLQDSFEKGEINEEFRTARLQDSEKLEATIDSQCLNTIGKKKTKKIKDEIMDRAVADEAEDIKS